MIPETLNSLDVVFGGRSAIYAQLELRISRVKPRIPIHHGRVNSCKDTPLQTSLDVTCKEVIEGDASFSVPEKNRPHSMASSVAVRGSAV